MPAWSTKHTDGNSRLPGILNTFRRRVAARAPGGGTVVLEWNTQPGSLVAVLLPNARRVSIRPDESSDALLRRIMGVEARPARVLLHIDLTDQRKLPAGRGRFLGELRRRGIADWNGRLADISKPAIQRANRRLGLPDTTARRQGPGAELVIVKTRRNHFGAPERELSAEERDALGYAQRWSTPLDGYEEYPVLPRARVPPSWWRSRALFPERFITNRRGEFFRVFVAGSHCVLCLCRSRALVKRPEDARFDVSVLLTRDRAEDASGARRLPARVWRAFQNAVRFMRAFGLDYGAVDMVRDDRQVPYIIDVNPTPWAGAALQREIREYLRGGFGAAGGGPAGSRLRAPARTPRPRPTPPRSP